MNENIKSNKSNSFKAFFKNLGRRLKKPTIILGIVLAIIATAFLSVQAYDAIIFHEGIVIGGSVTVSDNWLVYEDDSFITTDTVAESGKHFSEVYYELQEGGYVKASKENFYRISFDNEISVRLPSKQKFYLVGGYYIASPDTIKSYEEPSALPEG